jgi:hypothetical protein
MLKVTPRNEGAKGAGLNQHNKEEVLFQSSTAPTLADLGIDRKTSSVAQKLADMPAETVRGSFLFAAKENYMDGWTLAIIAIIVLALFTTGDVQEILISLGIFAVVTGVIYVIAHFLIKILVN